MQKTEILARLHELAAQRDPDQLLETSAASIHVELYDAAIDVFGSWDAALAAALCESVGREASESSNSSTEPIERVAGPEADEPIFALTDNQFVLEVAPGTELETTGALETLELPPKAGSVRRFQHVGEPEGFLFFTSAGNYFALDPRMIPSWSGADGVRRIGDRLDLTADESLEFLLPREALYGGRIVHVTRGGKGKATDAEDLQYTIDYEPRTAFKLEEDDHPVAVIQVPEETGLFAASAHGRGIHFPDDELRSMGARAIGVKIMDLEDATDAVVGAFRGDEAEEVAVLTRRGRGKRVDFEEFRQQGRAGAGMQLARLDRDDFVAAVAPCAPSDDLAVVTSKGRIRRRPAADLESMGRPAKGNRVVELADGETVRECTRLPCSGER